MNIFVRYNKTAGKNISLDWYFTSITLVQWCLGKHVSILDTIRIDRKGIPKEMKKLGNREEITTEFCYSVDNKMLQTLYIDKNTSGKENVKVLSTMYKDVTVTRNQRKKKQYNSFIWPCKRKSWCCGLDTFKIVSADEIKTVHTEYISFFSRYCAYWC